MSKPETRPEWLAANNEVQQLAKKYEDYNGFSRIPRAGIQDVAKRHGLDEAEALNVYAPWMAQ